MLSSSIIKGIRVSKNLSQEDVGKMLGLSRQRYNSLENNLLQTDFTFVFKLLKILKFSESETDTFFHALRQDLKSYIEK